jgi:eukaryotic translation initiation factor 2C
LACERGRCYIHDLLNSSDSKTFVSGSTAEEEVFKQAQLLWGRGVGKEVGETMFYI